MGKAQITLGMMLAMCVGAGACSTESTVQKDRAPSTGVSGDDGEDGGSLGGDVDAGGGGNDGATAGSAGDGDGPTTCPKGPTKGSSLLLIGDSYIALNDVFVPEITRLAKAAGALAADDKYANRSFSGTQMVGGVFAIPSQYADEKNTDGHVKTVIMTGGGNDILVGRRECITTSAPPENKNCIDTINAATAAAKTLLAKMSSDGVTNVIYFFYPTLPGGGAGGKKDLENKTLDYAYPLVKKACDEAAPVKCHFVDTRGLFGDTAADFQDGIHPTAPNTNKIVAAVWKKMQETCVAQ